MRKRISKKQNLPSAEVEKRCIWMTAGVISYKLCPLNYDCEHCDLDKAMRSEVKSKKIRPRLEKERFHSIVPTEIIPTARGSSKSPLLFFTFSPGEIKEGIYLHPTHLWARQMDEQRWRVGIDELLAYILPKPSKLEFTDLNKVLSKDQVFGKIITSVGTVFLTAPLPGRVIQINTGPVQNPELVQQDPYGEGWLAIIDWIEDRSELGKFFTGAPAKRFLQEEAQHLNFFLRHRGVEVNQIGETLPDGGVSIKYLHQVLPATVCMRLAVELMVTGKQAW